MMTKTLASIAILLTLSFNVAAQAPKKTFITDVCQNDDGCQSGCCSFLRGVCAGPVIAQERASDGGCGHGDAQPNRKAADAFLAGQAAQSNVGAAGATMTSVAVPSPNAQSAGTSSLQQQGNQFITGPCNSDNECARKCCDFQTGLCAAPIVAKENGHGCGRGSGAKVFKTS